MDTSSKKTAYSNKLAEMKEKYFPLLEKLIKTEKAEKFQAVYSALNNKRYCNIVNISFSSFIYDG